MKALGRNVIIKPLEETAPTIEFIIKRKVQKGVLVSKGADTPEELPVGSTVYYKAGHHNQFDQYIIISHRTIEGFENGEGK